MKYNFDRPLLELNGTPQTQDGKVFTFSMALQMGIMYSQKTPEAEKINYYDLGEKLKNTVGEIDLTVEELAIIKNVALQLITLTAGQIIKYIENVKAE